MARYPTRSIPSASSVLPAHVRKHQSSCPASLFFPLLQEFGLLPRWLQTALAPQTSWPCLGRTGLPARQDRLDRTYLACRPVCWTWQSCNFYSFYLLGKSAAQPWFWKARQNSQDRPAPYSLEFIWASWPSTARRSWLRHPAQSALVCRLCLMLVGFVPV